MKSFYNKNLFLIPLRIAVLSAVIMGLPVQLLSETSLELEKTGAEYYAKGDYRTAVHYYRQSLLKNPNNKNAQIGAGKSYLKLFDYPRSEEHFKQTLKLDGDNEEAMIGLGLLYIDQERYKEAGVYLDKVAEINPGNRENNYAKGLMFLKRKKYDIAEMYFKKVLKLNSNHIMSLLALSEIELSRGREDLSESYWSKAQKINPLDHDVHKMRAKLDLYYAEKQQNPEDKDLYLQKARESLLNSDPSAASGNGQDRQIIWIDLLKGDDAGAEQRVLSLLEKSPADIEMNYLAAILSAKGEKSPEIVAEYYSRILQHNSDDSIARYSFEDYVLSKEEFFSPSGELRKKLSSHHLSLANKYDAEGSSRRAFTHLQRGIMLYPDSKVLMEKRKEKLIRSGNFEGYLRDLVLLKRKFPDNYKLQHRLEVALLNKKKYISYRERLISEDDIGGQPTFKRTPPHIFVYDVRPTESFPAYPDASEKLANAIILYLNDPGRAEPVSKAFRNNVKKSIIVTSREKYHTGKGVYFNSSNLPFIEENESGIERVNYILDGKYSIKNGIIQLDVNLMEKATTRSIMNFSVRAGGKNAIHDIAYNVVKKIENLPHKGQIVKITNKAVFINMGSADGVKAGSKFYVSGKETLIVKELDYYVSGAVPENGRLHNFTEGDTVTIQQ